MQDQKMLLPAVCLLFLSQMFLEGGCQYSDYKVANDFEMHLLVCTQFFVAMRLYNYTALAIYSNLVTMHNLHQFNEVARKWLASRMSLKHQCSLTYMW